MIAFSNFPASKKIIYAADQHPSDKSELRRNSSISTTVSVAVIYFFLLSSTVNLKSKS